MRKPSEYVAAALRGLRAGPLAGNAALMSHGGRSASVSRVGSVQFGEDAISADAPAEAVRVLALSDDFPLLSKGEPVELDGSLHVVTSARRDASGASLTVGLSAAFCRFRAAYARKGSGPAFPVPVLALEDAALPSAYADAAAPASGQSWTVCVSAAEWPEPQPPQTGDGIRLDAPSGEARLKVASSVRHGSWWMLRARPRGSSW